jgi:hypothetical protein
VFAIQGNPPPTALQIAFNITDLWARTQRTFNEWWQIQEFQLLVWGLIALIIFVVISYVLLRMSRDRCIKEFEGYHVEAVLQSQQEGDATRYAYSGVLEVPIQAGNGFEVNYDLEAIENLPQLFSYLKAAERYTGNEKYQRTIRSIHERLEKVDRLDLESEYVLNPFDPPPEASHKIYQQDLARVLAIVRFFDELPPLEMKARLADVDKFFHPGFMRRSARGIGNFIAFAWDRVKQIANIITGYFTKGRSAEIQKLTTDAQGTAFAYTPRKYEALLENSIGYLVKLKVISPDGRIRNYRGVLKEYSDSFICVFNIFYRLPRAADYEKCNFLGLDPKAMFQVKGKPVERDQDIEVVCDGTVVELRNLSGHFIYLDKIEVDGQVMAGYRTLLGPDRSQRLDLQREFNKIRLVYEEAFPSDVVFPRKLAVVVGRAEPKLLKLESLRKIAAKAKDVPIANVKDFQSKLFISTGLLDKTDDKDIMSLRPEAKSQKRRR